MELKWPQITLPKYDRPSSDSSIGMLNWISGIVLLFGVLIVLLFGASTSSKATILLWMLACILAGTFLGFLFGIPKILQNSAVAVAANNSMGPVYQQQVNTNLTEISDWLTKIIVGLGLVNLTKLPPYLRSIATILAGGFSESSKAPSSLALAFAYATIISYCILGFLFGYIITRLYLAGAFSEADQKALSIITKKADDAVGAANSALQKAEFALAKPTEVSQNNTRTPEQKLDELARYYITTRNQMASGSARTTKMGEIFKSMIDVAAMATNFDVSAALKETDRGKRLAAFAYLYIKPDWEYLNELVDAITSDPTPFGQYWGIQTLRKVLALQPDRKMEPDSFNKLSIYYGSLKKGIDREYELRNLLPELTR